MRRSAKSSLQSPDTASFYIILIGIGFGMKFGEESGNWLSLKFGWCLRWGVGWGAVAAKVAV